MLRRRAAAANQSLQEYLLALADLVDLPLRRVSHRLLLARCWELRQNLTVTELLDVVLVTADARLAAAPGLRCRIELIG